MSWRNLLLGLAVLLLVPGAELAGRCPAAKPRSLDRVAAARRGVESQESFWHRIDEEEPYDSMGIRSVFAYALALAEAELHPERFERLCDIAGRAQDRDRESRGYGNFRWTWRDQEVTDGNAVEFCMQDAALVWRYHRDWLPEAARSKLRELMDLAVEGCLRHRVRTSYTNIAILNAGNLIALGEMLDRPDAAEEGYRRWDAVCLWTWQYGTHEYCSPTYYGVDLDGLLFIEALAEREDVRAQARSLLRLFWTDIALNWWPPSGRMAGPHSRSYDYVRGQGFMDRYPWLTGWLDDFQPHPMSLFHPLRGRWSPPEELREICFGHFPRLVRQSWGLKPEESRTHMLYRDVTLGISGAAYGLQDMALTVDLPGERGSTRCYFIPDGREDPYGKVKYERGRARHRKALHLEPFWAGAQRTCDAVGLVVYRDEDLSGDVVTNCQSHLVLRRDVDGIWLRGEPVQLSGGTAEEPVQVSVGHGDLLVLRQGTAAVGVRLLWARTRDGRPARASLVDDGTPWDALRLTVEHHSDVRTTEAAAAFWVRVGTGLDTDEAFQEWRKTLEGARPATVEANEAGVRVEVPGVDGPVGVSADAPFGRGTVELVPEPYAGTLELDGEEIGRPLLQAVDPVREFVEQVRSSQPVQVPAGANVRWEAESGIVFPGMAVGDAAEASGGRYVWHPPRNDWGLHSGSVTWTLDVAEAGRYWLWGRVLAPDSKTDSFYVLLGDHEQPSNDTSWHTGTGDRWRWQAVSFDRAKEPAVLDLDAGRIQLRLCVREAGTKIDRLFLTSSPDAKPE